MGNSPVVLEFKTNSEKDSIHEVEFLESENDELGDIERFQGNQYSQKLPKNKTHFRVRRTGAHGAIGFWTEKFSIQSFSKRNEPIQVPPDLDEAPVSRGDDIFIELVKDGKPFQYLNANKIAIEPNSSSKLGIDKTLYRLNHGDWNTMSKDGLQFLKDGEYQMDYYSIDLVGNKEQAKTVNFLVDTVPPLTELVFFTYAQDKNSVVYTRGSLDISLLAKDTGSGIEKTYYRYVCLNGKSNEFQTYNKAFPMKEGMDFCNSHFQIEYYSIDKVLNQEKTRTTYFSYIP
jgi:hypothetical protein